VFGSVTAIACLDAPPEYSVPDQIPPVLVTSQIAPPTRDVVVVPAAASQVDFLVPFRSDDSGEDLTALFVLDMARQVTFPFILDAVPVLADPRPFAAQDPARVVTYLYTWTERPVGRHRVTLILTHESNFSTRYEVQDALDAAEVTWILDFGGGTTP